jgi:N-acetylglutamate synthase-like GNAT family acetyltransferase
MLFWQIDIQSQRPFHITADTPPTMTDLRFATESELAALMELINRAFTVEKFFKKNDRLTPESTREYFRRGRFLVSGPQGEVHGCVFVELKGERAYLGLLSVDPARQKSGLGTLLVNAAEEYARELGARHMDLTIVNVREELPGYYGRMGYTVSGTEPIPPEVIGPVTMPCHFVVMTKALGKARESTPE